MKEGRTTNPYKLFREITGLALIFLALFLLLGLATYAPNDPSFNQVVGRGYKVQNSAGLVGAYFAGTLTEFFGLAGYLWPLGFAAAGLGCFFTRLSPAWWRWFGFLLFGACVLGGAESAWAKAHIAFGNITGGGFFGKILFDLARYYLRPMGALLVWLFTLITGVQLMAGLTWGLLFKRVYLSFLSLGFRYRERRAERRRQKKLKERAQAEKSAQAEKEQEASKRAVLHGPLFSDDREAEPVRSMPKSPARPRASGAVRAPGTASLPDLDLLDSFEEDLPAIDQDALQEQAKNLEACLADFGIQGEIQDVVPGPVVTMFEYKPAPGVKISRIAALSDDLALGLKATAVRVEAPLPGRDTVGIEVPNQKRRTVYLRQVMESSLFQDSKSLLTMALGKDIYGRPYVANLDRMPHLLVAGATGAGKSVCLNSILLSFLYKARPDEVKLLLVDPKRIELSGYAGLPHLVHPVVTDMLTAKSALEWAVYEMERRYEAMALLGARNIEGFNQKLAGLGEDRPEELQDLEPMPFLVIVIDELADLMLTAAKDVEIGIVRLAQLARAAGIHMILATQRPSVDVVTGLIKANFPCRISFQVTSRHDSRTILDGVGAEHLLGKGDMLFKPSGGKTIRLHGAFVDEDEIARVIAFWKEREEPRFDLDFNEWQTGAGDMPGGADGFAGNGGDMAGDPVYAEAVDFVMGHGKASISLIQRRFRIGFNRAARYIEQMERDGIIGPQDGSKPRMVLKTSD